MAERTCQGCTTEYLPEWPGQVYCSPACRNRARSRRKRRNRIERGHPGSTSASKLAYTVKPKACIMCCAPIVQSKTKTRYFCGKGVCPVSRPCRVCGEKFERWDDYGHPGSARTHCRPCYNDKARQRTKAKRRSRAKPAKVKTCPICKRSSPLGRRWYCTEFCRQIGRRLGQLRDLVHLPGEFHSIDRWWIREGSDLRWLAGPPPHPIEVWVTPDDVWLCPFCTSEMTGDDGEGRRICWCGVRVQPA